VDNHQCPSQFVAASGYHCPTPQQPTQRETIASFHPSKSSIIIFCSIKHANIQGPLHARYIFYLTKFKSKKSKKAKKHDRERGVEYRKRMTDIEDRVRI
jgi:hypothetical protein